MKENIKIGLLAIIAVTLVYSTFTDHHHEEEEHETAASHGHSHAKPPASAFAQQGSELDALGGDLFGQEELNPVPSGPTTTVAFAQEVHDFGQVDQDTKNEHLFTFTNTGEHPLLISNARGSCGCTVPEYPKEPIAPGETGEIRVVYSPGKQKGNQTKTVTITANTEPVETKLKITADVQESAG